METKNFKGFIITLILIVCAVAVLVRLTERNKIEEQQYKKGQDSINYLKGMVDSLLILGKPDTVVEKAFYPVYIEKPTPTHYGKDSTVYTVKNDSIRAKVITYPVTDSIKIEIEPLVVTKTIHQVDTLKITQIDTLKIYRVDTLITYRESDIPFYDHWEIGAIGTAAIAVITYLVFRKP
jgi:hypothetical protein